MKSKSESILGLQKAGHNRLTLSLHNADCYTDTIYNYLLDYMSQLYFSENVQTINYIKKNNKSARAMIQILMTYI